MADDTTGTDEKNLNDGDGSFVFAAERQRGRRLSLAELDGGREEIEEGFGGADAEAAGVIQVERADGGSAGWCEADDAGVLPGEVI